MNHDVDAARSGDREALERVATAVRPLVHRLALRFFGCPQHADDATQEVMLHLVTRLDRFDGRSAFTTWVYRVATNRFVSMARSPAERASRTFAEMDEDLATVAAPGAPPPDPDHDLLVAEVRIGCALAMLLCLDRDARMAYVLGAIAELDHRTAADVLGCSPAAYRKRLERAREAITGLMRRRCGVFDEDNDCRCERRIPTAIARGHVDPARLVFATSREQVARFPAVLAEIRRLEAVQRAAAIYQSHPEPRSRHDLVQRLGELAGSGTAAPDPDAAQG